MSIKTYKIGNKELSIPETKLKQYKKINRLIKDNLGDIDLSGRDSEQAIKLGRIITDLIAKDVVEQLLAAIFDHDDITVFEEITESTLIGVLTDFFSGKATLISSITGSFRKSLKNVSEPAEN